jgi:hypothetical protein
MFLSDLDCPLLTIPGFKLQDPWVTTEIAPCTYLAESGSKLFHALERRYADVPCQPWSATEGVRRLQSLKPEHVLSPHLDFGGHDSCIVDMQGIASLIFAKAILFDDSDVLAILKALRCIDTSLSYLRFGASGSKPRDGHPGGEVLEYSLIDAEGGKGVSRSQSGFIPAGGRFSERVPLSKKGHRELIDQRSVYSHTAWLSPQKQGEQRNILLEIEAHEERASVLDILSQAAATLGLEAFSIQISLEHQKESPHSSIVVGRVLRKIPESAMLTLKDAQKAGAEEHFPLSEGQQLIAFGSKYERNEPEWEAFSGGKRYEARGHTHALILGPSSPVGQHRLFHLRDIFLSRGQRCQIIITPVIRVLRVEPAVRKGFNIYSLASERILYAGDSRCPRS